MGDTDRAWHEIEPWMRDIRRHIHQYPELGLDTVATANVVERHLKAMGLEPRRLISHGVVADISAPKANRKALLLRADMDALPIEEGANGLTFRSSIPGRMHACGHDAHTAMLLGAARVLVSSRDALPQPVRLMFQPAEEGPGGALPMIRQGVLDGVGRALMIHVHSELPVGTIGTRMGPAWAATNDFRLAVVGRGGHGAHPNLGVDAIYVAAQIIQAIQSVVSREVDPTDPVVVSFGTIQGGFRENVIADRVELTGTIRTLTDETRDQVKTRFEQLVAGYASAHRADVEMTIQDGYPALICDPEWTETVVKTLVRWLPNCRLHALDRPSLGAEDFAYVSHRVPGTVLNLGVGSAPDGSGLHAPGFILDERALVVGAQALTAVALHGCDRAGADADLS